MAVPVVPVFTPLRLMGQTDILEIVMSIALFLKVFDHILVTNYQSYSWYLPEFLQAQVLSSYSKQPVLEFPAVLPSTQFSKS